MLPADNDASARAAQSAVGDPRFTFWYDADRTAAQEFAALTGIRGPAWDVYAVFDPAASWPPAEPSPRPAIWMHQLPPEAGVDEADRLNPGRLAEGWLRLAGDDTARTADLAAHIHVKGTEVAR